MRAKQVCTFNGPLIFGSLFKIVLITPCLPLLIQLQAPPTMHRWGCNASCCHCQRPALGVAQAALGVAWGFQCGKPVSPRRLKA